MQKYDCITPAKPWLDTDGNKIHAHGGSVLYADGTFYLYGENKEKSTAGSGIWHRGVRMYSSKDMYNWKSEGIIVPPETADDKSPLHYAQYLDRPHILYNEKTKKFVMWIKLMHKENLTVQSMVVLTADSVTGPYTFVKHFQPLGMSSGDFDLVKDEETKKAYIYFDKVHSEMICADLSEDYTDVTGTFSSHLPQPFCPLVREAPAFFKRNGKMYLLTSGTTGYFPNPTECAVSASYHGPWENIGTVHENDTERLSFRSQISSVFKHPKKKDLYIALADRWLVNIPKDLPHNFFEVILSYNDPSQKPLIPKAEYDRILECTRPDVRDISKAEYVWLPIFFDGDRPYIKWLDSWKIEDFD